MSVEEMKKLMENIQNASGSNILTDKQINQDIKKLRFWKSMGIEVKNVRLEDYDPEIHDAILEITTTWESKSLDKGTADMAGRHLSNIKWIETGQISHITPKPKGRKARLNNIGEVYEVDVYLNENYEIDDEFL